MKPSRRKVEEGLWVLGLHRFGRSLNTALNPQKRKRDKNMKSFYEALLPPAGLVFDVGATSELSQPCSPRLAIQWLQLSQTWIVFAMSRFRIPIYRSRF